MTIDAGYAQWLQSDALYASSTDAAIVSTWPTQAIESETISPFALAADAQDEADRQEALFAGPNVRDVHVVPGARRDLDAQVVTITNPRLGYAAGVNCFVIEADETQVAGCTVLTVLRRLDP